MSGEISGACARRERPRHGVARAHGFLALSLWCACGWREPRLEPPSTQQALEGLPRSASLPLRLRTNAGEIRCSLDVSETPRAVALFVGLARGRASWRDARDGRVRRDPYYRDLRFFRGVPKVLIQTGCPLGNGSGHPGYRIPVERSPRDMQRLREPGALLLARYQPPPNRDDPAPPPAGHVIGSQLVITLRDMSHLLGQVTVIGRCQDLPRVAELAERVLARQDARLIDVVFPDEAQRSSIERTKR